jgi:hypothetical protein
MIAHNPKAAKKAGVPQSVGQDFSNADKGRKFGSGGRVRKKFKHHAKLRPPPMAPMSPPDMGPPSPMGGAPPGMPPPGMGMKKGGFVKGSQVFRVPKTENKGGESKIGGGVERKGGTLTRKVAMKGSGRAQKGTTPTKMYAGGGMVRGDGCASRGHTKGRMV